MQYHQLSNLNNNNYCNKDPLLIINKNNSESTTSRTYTNFRNKCLPGNFGTRMCGKWIWKMQQ